VLQNDLLRKFIINVNCNGQGYWQNAGSSKLPFLIQGVVGKCPPLISDRWRLDSVSHEH
jgi:hypothetical protein